MAGLLVVAPGAVVGAYALSRREGERAREAFAGYQSPAADAVARRRLAANCDREVRAVGSEASPRRT